MRDNPLKSWWVQATPYQRDALAHEIGTTPQALRQMSMAYKTDGEVSLSPSTAAAIEKALHGAIRREDLCPACGQCDLAKVARRKE